jgi:hypothetical protein
MAVGCRFFNRQQTTKLNMAGASVRAQKAFALDYCAASFVTEGEFRMIYMGVDGLCFVSYAALSLRLFLFVTTCAWAWG